MICPEFTELASGQQGRTVLPKINQVALNQLPVPVPPLPEQVEIIQRIYSYFSFITKVTSQVEKATYEADYLERAILAKAFWGKTPTAAPASALLERIRAEREQQTQTTSSRRKRGSGK